MVGISCAPDVEKTRTALLTPSSMFPFATAMLGFGGSKLNWLPEFARRWSLWVIPLNPILPAAELADRLSTGICADGRFADVRFADVRFGDVKFADAKCSIAKV